MVKFVKKEDGLVTIEWVGIAAVMVLAAVAITAFVMQGADAAGGAVDDALAEVAKAPADVVKPGVYGDGDSTK
jgi:hypothetical protein